MKQYKVAIIGNGMICNAAHIPAYKAMGDKVKIVAVADIREEAAKETAERHGIPKYYVDPYKMLEEEKPDIISVCTPNAYHKEYTLAGFRAGCHVVCEKPVAVTCADAEEMFNAAEKAGNICLSSSLCVSQVTSKRLPDWQKAVAWETFTTRI